MKIGDRVRHRNGKEGVIVKGVGSRPGCVNANFGRHKCNVSIESLTVIETAEEYAERQKRELAESLKDSERYQRENFAIEIGNHLLMSKMIGISVTHNGFQWSMIQVFPDELAKVRDAINAYLEGKEGVKNDE